MTTILFDVMETKNSRRSSRYGNGAPVIFLFRRGDKKTDRE